VQRVVAALVGGLPPGAVPARLSAVSIPEVQDLVELHTMLAERALEWTQQWKEEGCARAGVKVSNGVEVSKRCRRTRERNSRVALLLLELLWAGMTVEEILADYEDLERADILAVLVFATRLSQVKRMQPGAV